MFPTIGAIVCECCGLDRTADVTQASTAYADMMSSLQPEYENPELPKRNVVIFKKTSFHKAFAFREPGKYQLLQLGIQKWHELYHICNGICKMGNLIYLHTGLVESIHKQLKSSNSLSLKRAKPVLHEDIKKENRRRGRDFKDQLLHECTRPANQSKVIAKKIFL